MNIPVISKLKLVWERLTLSWLTFLFFLFSVLHCAIQVTIQVRAFTVNVAAVHLLREIIAKSHVPSNGFAVLGKNDLRICTTAHVSLSASSCPVIWNGTVATGNLWLLNGQQTLNKTASISSLPPSTLSPSPTLSPSSSNNSSPSPSQSSILPTGVNKTPPSASSSSPISSFQSDSTTTLTRTSLATLTTTTVVTGAPLRNIELSGDRAQKLTGSGDNDIDDTDTDILLDPLSTLLIRGTVGNSGTTEKPAETKAQIQQVNPDGSQMISITGIGSDNITAVLQESCIRSLIYPLMVLRNTEREDISFIAFQFWVLGMNIVSVLNESIPHILASLLTHLLATAWAALHIWHTTQFESNFKRVTTRGACSPVNLLPTYWKARLDAEFAGLVFNAAGLMIAMFFTWKLVKLFGWQTFKRVGASLTMRRVYRNVLLLSIVIQLSVFFMCAAAALWVDEIFHGSIGMLARAATLHKVAFIITLILLWPWLATGWFAVRRELKTPMSIFLGMFVVYIGGWAIMFASDTFRWTFVLWEFFALITSASLVLALALFFLGVVCRLNFGKGLPRYLTAREALDDGDFEPKEKMNIEEGSISPQDKFAFPQAMELPSNSGNYGSFGSSPNDTPQTKNMSGDPVALSRHDSDRSVVENNQNSLSDGPSRGRSKRWVIE